MDLKTLSSFINEKKNQGNNLIACAVALKNQFAGINAVMFTDSITEIFGSITPDILMQAIHDAGFSATETAPQVKRKFPDTTALQMGQMLIKVYNNPSITEQETTSALNACGYSAAEVTDAISQLFRHDNYVLQINAGSCVTASSNYAYNFGTGDFSVCAWLKPSSSGTIISRKSGPGGPGNGGFLLVLKSNGVFKLATDNGYGFYEINSAVTAIFNSNWHFIVGTRQNGHLSLYLDGNLLQSTVRSNASTPLDVNNSMRLLMGMTDQYQEEFNHYKGLISKASVWNSALSQQQIQTIMNSGISGSEQNLKGYWPLNEGAGNLVQDKSLIHNNGTTVNTDWVKVDNNPYEGVYKCGVKWGGERGTWKNHTDLTYTQDKQILLGSTKINNVKIDGNNISWPFDGNSNSAGFTFMQSSDQQYYWPEGKQTKKLFQGWYQDPGSGKVDYRGLIKDNA